VHATPPRREGADYVVGLDCCFARRLSRKAVSEKPERDGGKACQRAMRDDRAMDDMRATDEMAVFGSHP
jgi:hypothetical protein